MTAIPTWITKREMIFLRGFSTLNFIKVIVFNNEQKKNVKVRYIWRYTPLDGIACGGKSKVNHILSDSVPDKANDAVGCMLTAGVWSCSLCDSIFLGEFIIDKSKDLNKVERSCNTTRSKLILH